ncbi:hypothetical protein EDD86DRAFT_53188 [Gorgonomyces haynaldii]|nr:hypothetical protein EDD86DRAFT_53188 [Gorgonomyces haynaldii]
MDKGSRIIALGWTCFTAENLIMSENRQWIIEQLGNEKRYHLVYNSLSTAACASIAYGFLRYRKGTSVTPFGGRLLPFFFHGLGFVGLSQLLPEIHLDRSTKDNAQETPKDGIKRITRHPMLFSLGLAGLGSCLRSTFLAERILYGFPIVFAFVGGAHQDKRFLNSGKLAQTQYDNTSLIPFQAVLEGKQDLSQIQKEIKWTNAFLGLAVALLFSIL